MAQVSTTKSSRPIKADGASGMMGRTSKNSMPQGIITSLIIIVLIGAALWFMGSRSSAEIVLNAEWQAVFLDNGQVYFGKVINVTDSTVRLEDIYYLQVINQPLQRTVEEGEQPAEQQAEQRLTLFKLGNEIHGPEDTMFINKDHVILIEDLKEEGQVVRAIRDYVTNGQQQPIE